MLTDWLEVRILPDQLGEAATPPNPPPIPAVSPLFYERKEMEERIDELAQLLQQNGYCEKSSYRWISMVLGHTAGTESIDQVFNVYEQQFGAKV